jgi:glycolate oxidase FAD binding subunit
VPRGVAGDEARRAEADAAVTERPGSPEEAASLLRELGAAGRAVRVRGGGTKLDWGGLGEPVAVELETGGLDRILEHNEGDLTAVLQAGVPLAAAQAAFAEAGQMLALDPPLGGAGRATVGGVMATADSGPLRHRYGGVRDLVVGITVALSDGTLAKAGGKVIKNVAGYDLGKLFVGSYGTLGLIVSVSVRLHPKPAGTATAVATGDHPARLAEAASMLVALPLEADCLDATWRDGQGRLLVRFGGAAAVDQAEAAADRLRHSGLLDVTTIDDDDGLWADVRDLQRAPVAVGATGAPAGGDVGGAVLNVSGRITDLAPAMHAASDAGGTLVSRAAHGLSWIALEGDDLAERVGAVREALEPRACVLLDGPEPLRREVDPWGPLDPGALTVMRRVKERFDTARIFRPGSFVGGI